MFEKIGGFTVKYRYWLVGAWIVLAVLMFLFAPSLSEVGSMDESNFLPKDSESLDARRLIVEYFPESTSGSTVSLVFFNQGGLVESDLAYARQVSDWLVSGQTPFTVETVTSIFTNPELESRLISPDNTTMLLNIGLQQSAFDSGGEEIVTDIRDYLDSAPDSLDVYASGQVAIYADLMESLLRSIDLTTIVTIILIIVLLLAIYRSPLSALVPLVTIGIAYLVSRGLLGIIADAGVSVWSQLDIFIIVLVFGVGTDYCLFLISRYREELAKYDSRAEAMKHTVGRIGEVIAASAFAVIVGLSAMAVARYQMIQTMGPLMGLSILTTLIAALTLTPALASVFGRALFWPRHTIIHKDVAPRESGFWYHIARIATKRPIWVIVILVVLLLLPYFALPDLNRSYDQMAEIPQDSESIQGFKILEEHYDIGEMDPMTGIIVAGSGIDLTGPQALAAMSALATDLRTIDGVVKVQSIVQPEGTAESPAALTVAGQLGTIGQQITASFSGDTDPSALFSEDIDKGLLQVSAYLDELAASYPWVKDNEAFQGLQNDIGSIQAAIETVRAGVMVENQLGQLSQQLGMAALSPVGSQGTITEQAAGLVLLTKAYLDELAVVYPTVTDAPAYVTADTIAAGTSAALVSSVPPRMQPEDVQVLMADLPGSLQKLAGGMAELAAWFHGKGAVLISQVLAQAEDTPSAQQVLQQHVASFSANLQALASIFIRQGNPVYLSPSLLGSSPEAAGLLDTFYSQDRQAMRFYVVLDSYPQSDRAINTVKQVRSVMASSIDKAGLRPAEALIGGTSAEVTDVQTVLNSDFNIIMAVVIAAIFLVLALLLRSLVAPVYLLLTVLLSYASTLGICSWLFQDVLGHAGISFMVPIIVFTLLVALGSDYNIFLMSRVREEATSNVPHMAARLAVIATGGVITACGIILAGTFGVLVITPIRTMMHIGTAVAIGVLLDTFLVRALLVPAIASLLGRWNWWPRRYGKQE